MKYFFIVQGEGMGHTTQSLALRSILEKNGHSVVTTLLGTNFLRGENKLYRTVPHDRFFSPVFLSRRDRNGINLYSTFLYNFFLSPVYLFSIIRIACRIRASEAHVVIVFYDMMGQFGAFFSFSGKPVFSVSHHFFFDHPSFRWPADRKVERMMLKIHSWMASIGARKKLALSFTKENPVPRKKLFIVPPLLRREILDAFPVPGDHIHVYLLQAGFLYHMIGMARQNPRIQFRIFLHEFKTDFELPSNVHVSLISGDEFLESIKTSSMVICTAGFETLAEAIYLNKPLRVIPSTGHFEQYCNAVDAVRVSAARITDIFTVNEQNVSTDNPAHVQFLKWIGKAEEIILKCLTE